MTQIGKNKITLISFTIIVIITGGFFVKNISSPAPSPLSVEWKTFTNTRFGYNVEYPTSVVMGTAGQDSDTPSPPRPEEDVEVRFVSNTSQIVISVQSPSDYKKYLKEHSFTLEDRKRYEKIVNHISSNLKTYTQTIYQYQVSDSNPSVKNKQVGPLEESIIDGQKAYQFTLTGSFAFDATGRTGYTIGDKPSMYVITESPSGDKFIIHYLAGDPVSEKMFHSFKFVR